VETARLRRLGERLNSDLPLLGPAIRRRACRALAADSGADTVPVLVGAMCSRDVTVRAVAEAALRSLTQPRAVDALCAHWVEGRDVHTGAIIAECRYVASKPVGTRVLSALQADVLAGGDVGAARVQPLLAALSDADAAIRERAAVALRGLVRQPAIDSLCDAAIADPSGPSAAIAVENDYQHSVVSRRCLVLLLTGQIERYVDLDFDLQYARAEYEAGDDGLRGRIADAVRRSGDTRLAGLMLGSAPSTGAISKRAAELTEREASVVVEVYTRHSRWADIFALTFHMPLCAVLPALDVLAEAGWSPQDDVEAALLRDLLALRREVGSRAEPPPAPDVVIGSVIHEWIAEG